jgi:outer membrane protein TolC
LLERAVAGDPQVQAAQAALASAQARYRQARSRLLPNLGVQSTNGRSTDQDGPFNVERHTSQLEATLRWNLYRSGADYADMVAGGYEVMAAAADLRRAKEESAERIAEAYFDVQRLARTLSLAEARLADVVQLVAQVARQSEAGKVSELDLQQAQNAQLEAELAQDSLASDYQSAQIKLQRLTDPLNRGVLAASGSASGSASGNESASEPANELADFAFSQSGAADSARNAALAAAQARASAARLRVRSLAETLAPNVNLDVRHLLNNHTTPPQSTVQKNGWSLGISLDVPLGGENFARRDESKSRAAQAEAEAARAEQNARTEFDGLAPRIANARRALLNLAEQEKKMALLMRGSSIQFEAGRRNVQQIIQGRDNYFALQQRRLEQNHRLLLAQMRQLALGGQLLGAFGLLP